MKIIFSHDWNEKSYDCRVEGVNRTLIIELSYKKNKGTILATEIVGKNLYFIELWGGDGPSQNAIHVVDSKNEALDSINEFFEKCNRFVDEDEIKEKTDLLNEVKRKYFQIL
jgi:hypothetical protein